MKIADVIALAGELHGDQDVTLVLAIAEKESGRHANDGTLVDFNERAFAEDRNGGSYGLMQLDMGTARDRGFKGQPWDLYDPRENMTLGVAQLDWIARYLRAHSSLGLASVIAAYNEGVGAAVRGNSDPRYVGVVTDYRTTWQRKLGSGPS